jgi:hypothetical protein
METLITLFILYIIFRAFLRHTFLGRTMLILLRITLDALKAIYYMSLKLHRRVRKYNQKVKRSYEEPAHDNVINFKKYARAHK